MDIFEQNPFIEINDLLFEDIGLSGEQITRGLEYLYMIKYITGGANATQ